MNQCISKHLLLCTLFFLSGCNAIIEWSKKSFKQGVDLDNTRSIVAESIRSETVYDQLNTKARFVALWLNDAVRTEYARLHARSRGSSEDQYNALLRRQLEENNHFITFYILSYAEILLGAPESEWSIFLRINETTVIVPTDVKAFDLPVEYKFFFGKDFTRFKIAYRVIFDAKDLEDRCILDTSTQTVTLFFRSASKEVCLSWDATSELLHCKVERSVIPTPQLLPEVP